MATEDAVREALATVNDPRSTDPITELGMVKSVEIGADGAVAVTVYLTVSGCPMRDTITSDVTEAVSAGRGRHRASTSTLDVMSDEQRRSWRPRCAAARPSARCPSPSPAR